MRLDMHPEDIAVSLDAVACAFCADDVEGRWLEGTPSPAVEDCCMFVMAREVADVVIAIAFRAEDPTIESRDNFRCDCADDDDDSSLVCCGLFVVVFTDNPS